MPAVRSGLAALKEFQAEQARKAEERNRPSAAWFRWTSNAEKTGKKVDTVVARFLNDWNEESEVGAKFGAPIIAVEHQAPGDKGFTRRMVCTIEDGGECLGCEQHALRREEDEGQWRQRTNLYMNALVNFGDEQKVVIISRPAGSPFVSDLLQELEDEHDISGANYRIKVSGTGNQTKWSPKRLAGEPFSLEGVEVYDLNELALRHVPYSEQEKYFSAVYNFNSGSAATDEKSSDAGSTSVDETW